MPVDRHANVEECEVNGALLLTIRLQRWFGMAPVHIRKRESQYFVSICRLYIYLGYIFSIINCVPLLLAMFWDISIKDTSRTVSFGSSSRGMLWLMNVVICTGTCLFGCLEAEKRILHLMSCLKEISQINLLVKNQRDQSKKNGNVSSILFNYSCLVMLIVLLYYVAFLNESKKGTEMRIFYLNTFENTQYFQMFLAGILYTYTVQLFNVSLHLINCQLEDISLDVENNLNVSENKEEMNEGEDPPLKVSTKSVNRAIDQLGVTELKRPASALSEEKEEKLHQLLRQQDRVCVLIARSNKRDGMLMLCVIYTYAMSIMEIIYNSIATLSEAENTSYWIYFYCTQLLWFFWVTINIVIIVNSCERTTSERTETKRLVSCLMTHVARSNDPLYNILDSYYHRLRLDNVHYSPLGLLQLNHNFMFTVMGGIISYLFIFIDFNLDTGFTYKHT